MRKSTSKQCWKWGNYEVSKNQVFHSYWTVSKEEFEEMEKQLKQIRSKIRENTNYNKIFDDALKVASEISPRIFQDDSGKD